MIINYTNNVPDDTLTAKVLRHDDVGRSLNFWSIEARIHDKPIQFLICKGDFDGDKDGFEGYTLANATTITTIGQSPTLEGIADLFNQVIADAKAHDIVVFKSPLLNREMVIAR